MVERRAAGPRVARERRPRRQQRASEARPRLRGAHRPRRRRRGAGVRRDSAEARALDAHRARGPLERPVVLPLGAAQRGRALECADGDARRGDALRDSREARDAQPQPGVVPSGVGGPAGRGERAGPVAGRLEELREVPRAGQAQRRVPGRLVLLGRGAHVLEDLLVERRDGVGGRRRGRLRREGGVARRRLVVRPAEPQLAPLGVLDGVALAALLRPRVDGLPGHCSLYALSCKWL